MNAIDRAVSGSVGARLSSEQKKTVVLLARRAFDRLCEEGKLGDAAEFDSWRRREQLLTVERSSLRDATQEDFAPLKAHFLRLLGQGETADRTLARARTSGLEFARAKLRHELDAARETLGDPEAYAAAIARRKWRMELDELSEKRVWSLIFDVRRNAQRKRKLRRMPSAPERIDGSVQSDVRQEVTP